MGTPERVGSCVEHGFATSGVPACERLRLTEVGLRQRVDVLVPEGGRGRVEVLVGRVPSVLSPFANERFPVESEVDRPPELRVVPEQRA